MNAFESYFIAFFFFCGILKTENPATPPMFCMMLRKHFQGARFAGAEQLGFERAARLTFDTHDDMGFASKKHIICELMGRFSNIIITFATWWN